LVFFIRSDFCLSFARLSLAWLFALGRLLTWLDLIPLRYGGLGIDSHLPRVL
jgi:hypothetical protein